MVDFPIKNGDFPMGQSPPRGTCQLGQLRLLRIDPFAGPELRPQSFIRSFEERSPPWNVAGAHPDHQAARLILMATIKKGEGEWKKWSKYVMYIHEQR